jgi:argininosuccinate lyase
MIHLRSFDTPYPNPYDVGSWGACAGVPPAKERREANGAVGKDIARYRDRFTYCTRTDKAWIVCLHNAGTLDSATAAKVLKTLCELENSDPKTRRGGGERDVIPALDGDEDIGSLINLGRTMQEPMSRMQMRDQMLDFFDYLFALVEAVGKMAEEHVETVMPGHTHLSQANPITLALYLLSLQDNLLRGLTQLEMAYALVDKNSGGCGSCSGTVWPVDRWELTRLLGFEDLLEVTYDCEASQDHTLAVLFALTNILTSISKTTKDIQIWGLEEMDMIRIDPSWGGLSSMMPQKCHPGGDNENVRGRVCEIIGITMGAIATCEGEPHQDLVTMMNLPHRAIQAMAGGKACLRIFKGILENIYPQTDTMREYVRQGYSCMTEVVVHMVQNLGYGGRRAHRTCATLVRLARERGIPAPQLTGEMLDEAARAVEEEPPHIDTATLTRLLDPVAFINNHSNTGGPAPDEVRRMLGSRRRQLAAARERQAERVARVEAGHALLASEIERICKLAEQ